MDDSAISSFCEATNSDPDTARQFLQHSGGSLEEAVEAYYASHEGDGLSGDGVSTDPQQQVPPPHAGGLGGGASGGSGAALSSSSGGLPTDQAASSRVKPPPEKKNFGSLADLRRAEEDNDKDEDSEKEQEFFAGGDKSGLAVQDPNQAQGDGTPRDQIQRLLRTAKRHTAQHPPREEPAEPARRSAFTGAGQTLGADDVPSQTIPDPRAGANAPQQPRMVARTLHLWQDGFSVDDGPLYRFDDPANARTLDMINQGAAPLDIMNVQNGQAVDVKVQQHKNEKYVQPKKKYKPFEGQGQRLGSPTPEIGGGAENTTSSTVAATSAAATSAPATSASTNNRTPSVQLDPSAATVLLQIRLADGTRLPSRFNDTHTIGEVYDFIAQADAAAATRSYVLATTFPTRELTDKAEVLKDTELKRGGVVVQKWT
ncbi:MAG: hypothetical protein M1831_000590 [Alyxoria varia]|nr:MAG: hypothetical protein M1831_000590 [Alyxoria varia]